MYDTTLACAKKLDKSDTLRHFRKKFNIPLHTDGKSCIYFCGNSLGVQPKLAKKYVNQELKKWQDVGIEGFFTTDTPWLHYHDLIADKMARVVGAKPHEISVMNTLTVNLHLMMVSFYQPTPTRHKILMDWNPFPSDTYAVASQARFHGYTPEQVILEPQPKAGSAIIETENILQLIENEGDTIALVMLGGINYYSGQLYDLKRITESAQRKGCRVGFDLAHAAGNVILNLHEVGCDFAVWCNYKYLNSGPGALGAAFIHERHHAADLPRFEGWWGNHLKSRFLMGPVFDAAEGAQAWQLSTTPMLSMAPIRASMDIFEETNIETLVAKSRKLTEYLAFLLDDFNNEKIEIITPNHQNERGCQLSIRVKGADKKIHDNIMANGVICDWREPDVIRIAPVPLYNSFEDVWHFMEILKKSIK